jgi:N6-adenosine-specific RNA methylase IME4
MNQKNSNSNGNKNNKKYKTILADPAWNIGQIGGSHGAIRHYDLMTVEEIKAMPVADLAETDAHCWLWVTNATLRHGYDVLEAWGFTPRSILTWCKPRIALGNYLRNATEHLLLGTRGNAPVEFKGQATWTFAPLQDHSHKPEEQYAIIERISRPPYLELFARRRPTNPEWDVWGNEIDSDITIAGYPVPRLSSKATNAAPDIQATTNSNNNNNNNKKTTSKGGDHA